MLADILDYTLSISVSDIGETLRPYEIFVILFALSSFIYLCGRTLKRNPWIYAPIRDQKWISAKNRIRLCIFLSGCLTIATLAVLATGFYVENEKLRTENKHLKEQVSGLKSFLGTFDPVKQDGNRNGL